MRWSALPALLILGGCAAQEPPPVGRPAWQCDADASQSLIGSHYGAVTFPADAHVRFVCTECPMTRDYRPDRLTIFYDEASGVIENVQCV